MVKLLLDMKERLDTILIEAFGRAESFGHALKDAFEHFINQRANRWASVFLTCCSEERSVLLVWANVLPWPWVSIGSSMQ